MKKILSWAGSLVSGIAKIFTTILVIALLSPMVYFAWRAGQPMEMPQYDGRTYYELLQERQGAYDALAQKYQASHPNTRVKAGVCFFTETSILTLAAIPNAGFYALAGVYPALKIHVNAEDLKDGYVPEQVTWFTFLPEWWRIYEKFVWGAITHAPKSPVPYCTIHLPS